MVSVRFSTLRQFFREFYRPLRLRGKSPHSVRLHEVTLNNFARFLKREPTLDDLNDETMACFLSWLRDRGRAAITANDNRNRLMALARFAFRKGHLAQEPEVAPEVEPERVVRAWLTEDLDQLFAAFSALRGHMGRVPAALWFVGLHLVLLFTGERISAMLSLRWEQVDLNSGWMWLSAEQRKGRKRDKQWPLPPAAITLLQKIRCYSTGKLVFEHDCCVSTIYNRYGKILDDAGLPTDRQSKFHRMRKTTASHFTARGGNATALLDHSSAKVTKKYIDKRIVTDESAMDLLFVPREAQNFIDRNKIGPL